jgi:hypothetical protein
MAFNIYSTIRDLLNDERAKAVLEKHLPGASNHPRLPEAMYMSLGEVAGYPEAGISADKLQAILADLAQIGT